MIYPIGAGNGRVELEQGRRITECDHKSTISTITAGLERVVCEGCGDVSVRYIEPTVRLYPDLDDNAISERATSTMPYDGRINGCGWCSNRVEFLIPAGMACAQHAWKEASRQQVMGSEPWIPISIDQRTKTT